MTRTVFITGATSGIGRATTKLLFDQGYQIIACGRREDRLRELREELGERIHTLEFDVRNREAVIAAVASLPAPFNQVDVLINNAGNAHGLDPIQSGNVDDWDAMLDINVKGLLYVTKALLPALMKSENPHILNIGSTAGKEVYPGGNVYCASKHALEGMTKSMAIEWGSKGIRVNTLCPTFIRTPLAEQTLKNPERRAWIESMIKLGRVGEIEDMMGPVVFLASDASALMTGTSLLIDGGWTAD